MTSRAHSLHACLSPAPYPQRVQFEVKSLRQPNYLGNGPAAGLFWWPGDDCTRGQVMADAAVSGVIGPDGQSQRARQGKFKVPPQLEDDLSQVTLNAP